MALTARKASSGPQIPRIKKPAVSGGTKEGGSGLRVRRLKHKAVIVCEVPHICPLVEWISSLRTAGTRIRTLEQAMLALVIEYSKLLLLFLLIGTVVTVSHFSERRGFSSARPREGGDPAL
jgi:hypothetical protein